MVSAFGGDFISYSYDGLVWSTEMKATLIGPQATKTGIAYSGVLQFAQLAAEPTIAQLISIGTSHDLSKDRSFTLRSSVQNSGVLFSNNIDDSDHII